MRRRGEYSGWRRSRASLHHLPVAGLTGVVRAVGPKSGSRASIVLGQGDSAASRRGRALIPPSSPSIHPVLLQVGLIAALFPLSGALQRPRHSLGKYQVVRSGLSSCVGLHQPPQLPPFLFSSALSCSSEPLDVRHFAIVVQNDRSYPVDKSQKLAVAFSASVRCFCRT